MKQFLTDSNRKKKRNPREVPGFSFIMDFSPLCLSSATESKRCGVCYLHRSLHFKVLSLFQTFSSVLPKEEEKWMYRNVQIGVYKQCLSCMFLSH